MRQSKHHILEYNGIGWPDTYRLHVDSSLEALYHLQTFGRRWFVVLLCFSIFLTVRLNSLHKRLKILYNTFRGFCYLTVPFFFFRNWFFEICFIHINNILLVPDIIFFSLFFFLHISQLFSNQSQMKSMIGRSIEMQNFQYWMTPITVTRVFQLCANNMCS